MCDKNHIRGRSRLPFTLIELLVITSQLCRDFFKRFICTDKCGCVRKHTENAAHKNTPLFLKEKGSARGKENFFSREKKFACPLASPPFTLIELLVVIAIIAILAGLLMPALSSSRERSKSVSCASNVKTLAMACLAYADDYDGHMSRVGGINGFNNGKAWIGKCGKWSSIDLAEQGLVTPYFGNNIKVKSCPSVEGELINRKSGLFHGGGIGLNLNFGSTGMWKTVKLPQVKSPASKVMLSDIMGTYQGSNICLGYKLTPYGEYVTGYNGTMGTGTPDSCFRHNGRANTGWVDGHVSTEAPAELDISGVLALYNVGWLSVEPNRYRLTQWQEDWSADK